MSSRTFQYNQVPGAFPSDEQDMYSYMGMGLFPNNQNDPLQPQEYSAGTMNHVNRGTFGEHHRSFLPYSSRPQHTQSIIHHNDLTTAFQQFQQYEQAQFSRDWNQNTSFNVTASRQKNEPSTYTYEPSLTAYDGRDNTQYGPSGRYGRTSSTGNGAMMYREPSVLPSQSWSRDSSLPRTSGRNSSYTATNSVQHYGPQSGQTQYCAYGGASPFQDQPTANLLRGHGSKDAHNSVTASQAPVTYITNAGGSKSHFGPDIQEQEIRIELVKKAKKKTGLRGKTCPTLRKTPKGQGTTKVVNGQLMWLDPKEPKDNQWKPAVIMDDIRKYILQQQDRQAQALGSGYSHPDEPGGEPYGETAFFYPHRNLGKARDARADLVFMIEETDQRVQPDYDPGWMMFDWRTKEIRDDGSLIVLSPLDNPIVNWREIPLCVSPHMDPSKMEYIRRLNKAIRHQDIFARMPRWYREKPNDARTLRQISDTNGMVSMPMKRFRERAGCLAWSDRAGSDELKLGLRALLNSTALGRQCLAANSMKDFGRDLTNDEITFVKQGNANGRFLKNAGDRAADEETRKKRKANDERRIANALKPEDSSLEATPTPVLLAPAFKKRDSLGPVNPRKRHRSDDEDNLGGSDYHVSVQHKPSKRIRPARKEHGSPIEDADLAMFAESQLSTESQDQIQRYPLINPATEDVMQEEHAKVEDPYSADSPEGGDEYPDDEYTNDHYADNERSYDQYSDEQVSGAIRGSQDDDSAPVSDSVPVSVHMPPEEVIVQEDEVQQDQEGNGHREDLDDKGDEPDTTTPIPSSPVTTLTNTTTPNLTSEDSHHPLSGLSNTQAKESDLEVHRKWVRDLLYEDQEDYASSLQRRTTAQPPARYPNAIDPLNPSATTTSGTLNYSEIPPSTDREVASLAEALLPTKKLFRQWTGQTAPHADAKKSYGEQWRELHQSFKEWWSNKNVKEPLPILVGVTHWGSSLEEWEPVKKDAVYYEAYKKGHWAPRDEHARIVDVPGPLLEKFEDMVY